MSDVIGRITVPALVSSGLTFPLVSDFGYSTATSYPVVVHRFGQLNAQSEQRFQVGIGPQKVSFRRQILSMVHRNTLATFWESIQGSNQSFVYNCPNANQTTTALTVVWEKEPLSLDYLVNACKTGFNFVQVPTANPSYAVSSTCLRFPSTTLQTALLSQVQQIIPLIHIRVRESAVPDIYLSDRRCQVGGQNYLPRVLGIGEPGSDVLITQDIRGTADSVQFQFGNADRVMTQLANDTDLKYAQIDLCLYHVNSGILLQLWSGFIQQFVSDGTNIFKVTCSDGMFQLTQQYPQRTLSRTCWKTYDDGVNCPFSTQGASSANVTAAGGDPGSCDFYWNSANGCLVHGMSPYFGGLPQVVQSVNVKDNSTGFLGFDRNTVTATSLVSDTMWGQALPEIWCNQGSSAIFAFTANGILAIVRDNGDYFDVFAVIGAGPLGSYSIVGNYAGEFLTNSDGFTYLCAPLADGFPAQGLSIASNGTSTAKNSALGLRQVVGNEPTSNTSYEQFDLANIVGTVPPTNMGPDAKQKNLPFAAGVAFVELLYPKPSGFTPSAPESHSLTVPVAQGLSGRVWDSGGTASWVGGLIDPVWVAINSYLRALGLTPRATDSGGQIAAQLATFNLADACAASAICSTYVTPILGSGTELQFQFQGVIGTQRPFRDWLTQILATALCYYTFEFGQLKIGIRINASSVDAYTVGNILFQSLSLSPIEASFERLILSFADVAYQYQANTAEYVDKSHASYYGRSSSPLTARQNVVGCSTLSQALRLAATRTREEIGGVNTAEWRNARDAYWKTTLLGLNNSVGQVVSITHPDVPGLRGVLTITSGVASFVSGDAFDDSMLNHVVLLNGVQYEITTVTDVGGVATYLEFTPTPANGSYTFQVITGDVRIQSWSLMKDYSVAIKAKTVVPSMYDLDVGPKPMDVLPAPVQGLTEDLPGQMCWAPYQVQYPSNDPVFPSEWTFDLGQDYTTDTDGTIAASALITGVTPSNQFSPGSYAATVYSVSQSTTGGSLPGGAMVRVVVATQDSNGLTTLLTRVLLVQIPTGTNTNTITLSVIWPTTSGLTNYLLFASLYDDLICLQSSGALSGGPTYTPTSITLTALVRSTWGVTSPNVSSVNYKAKLAVNSGVAGVAVTSVSSHTIVSTQMIDTTGSGWTPVGRVVSLIGRPTGNSQPFNTVVTAWAPTTGTMTCSPDPNGIVLAGDAIVVRFLAYDNTSTPTSITDAGVVNVTNAFAGMSNPLAGVLLRVIAGKGRGQTRLITGNTTTQLSWNVPLVMDSTSIFTTEESYWPWVTPSGQITNGHPLAVGKTRVDCGNFQYETLVASAFVVDVNGVETPDGNQPVREMFLYGGVGVSSAIGQVTVAVTPYAVSATDTVLTLVSGSSVVNLPSQTGLVRQTLWLVNASSSSVTVNAHSGETIEGSVSLTLTPGSRYQLVPNS